MRGFEDMEQCLYLKIYEDIKKRIISGEIKNDERLPTEKEIGEKYGVSRITAIKAMQKLENESLVRRVRGSGTFVCYSDISTFGKYRFSINTHSKNIAFVASCNIDFVLPILAAFQKIAIAHGYNVSIFDTAQNSAIETNILRSLNADDFCGIIFKPTSLFASVGELYKIAKKNIPLVFLDTNIPMIKAPCVRSNNYKGGYLLTKKLIEYGHTNIAVVFSNFSSFNEQERFGGYLKALMEHDIKFNPKNVYYYDTGIVNDLTNINMHTPIRLNNNIKGLFSPSNPHTACFCFYDMLASYVEQMAFESGYKIPDVLSIAGYDNGTICEQMLSPLTSVDQNYGAIAEKAFDVMLDMLQGKNVNFDNLIEPEVCVRDSLKRIN